MLFPALAAIGSAMDTVARIWFSKTNGSRSPAVSSIIAQDTVIKIKKHFSILIVDSKR